MPAHGLPAGHPRKSGSATREKARGLATRLEHRVWRFPARLGRPVSPRSSAPADEARIGAVLDLVENGWGDVAGLVLGHGGLRAVGWGSGGPEQVLLDAGLREQVVVGRGLALVVEFSGAALHLVEVAVGELVLVEKLSVHLFDGEVEALEVGIDDLANQ